jgi:hypothetical protein
VDVGVDVDVVVVSSTVVDVDSSGAGAVVVVVVVVAGSRFGLAVFGGAVAGTVGTTGAGTTAVARGCGAGRTSR